MANTVSVSAVPFNQQTQSFGSVSTPQVNLPTAQPGVPTAAQNLAAYQASIQPITPSVVPKTQSISTFNTQPIQLPSQQQKQIQPTINSAQTYLQSQKDISTPVNDLNNTLSSSIANLYSGLSGQATDTTNALNSQNILNQKKNQQNLANQVLQKQAELNQDDVSLAAGLQNIQDQPIPMQFITGQQASVQQRANIARGFKVAEIGVLNAESQAAQGNIALALQTAQAAVDAKYAPIKEQITILQAQQQAIQPMLNSEEKKVAAYQTVLANVAKQSLDAQIANQKQATDLYIQAAGVAPADVLAKAKTAINNGASASDIATILGPYGGKEYLANKDYFDYIRNTTSSGIGQTTQENGYTLDDFKKGIATTESSNNYSAIGPATKSGDKAYGKYQVMGSNIPSWTKQALGVSMTPQQFLNDPSAQEKVFEFQSLNNYAKYGNWDDVASVWFSGKPLANNNSSDGYNTVPAYVQKVRANMGIQPPSIAQDSSLPPKVQYNLSVGKVQPGQIVSIATGDVPKNVNDTQANGLLALQDLVQKVDQYKELYNKDAGQGISGALFGTGIVKGTVESVFPSTTTTALNTLKSEIVDLLSRARSGAALTPYEEAQYAEKLPTLFTGDKLFNNPGVLLDGLKKSFQDTLDTKLKGYGAMIIPEPNADQFYQQMNSGKVQADTQVNASGGYRL